MARCGEHLLQKSQAINTRSVLSTKLRAATGLRRAAWAYACTNAHLVHFRIKASKYLQVQIAVRTSRCRFHGCCCPVSQLGR